MSKEEVIKT